MEVTARLGWIGRGALYLLLAVLIVRVPTSGGPGEKVDKQGAFTELAESPFGGWLLSVVAIGLGGFAIWRTWAVVRGTEEKTNRRIGWAASAVVYAALAMLAFGVLRGSEGGGGDGEKALTARVLAWPGGQVLVGLVAVLVLAVAANYVRKGIKERFLHDVDEGAVPDSLATPVRILGVVGWLGRALVWALVGWFLLRAAVQHDPNEPIGLDETLRRLADESWGVTLIWVAAGGMLAYAVLCAATAAWPDPEPDSH